MWTGLQHKIRFLLWVMVKNHWKILLYRVVYAVTCGVWDPFWWAPPAPSASALALALFHTFSSGNITLPVIPSAWKQTSFSFRVTPGITSSGGLSHCFRLTVSPLQQPPNLPCAHLFLYCDHLLMVLSPSFNLSVSISHFSLRPKVCLWKA